jgi:tryptophan synthase alpha chain
MPAVSTSRIGTVFRDLRERGEKGLVVYMTAGDPSLEATGEILQAMDQGGADVIELGVPFSDPLADGPVIQHASERALKAGTTLRKLMALLPSWRARVGAPIVLFSYYNPILQYGLDIFAQEARSAGVDGVLAVDLTPEEADPYLRATRTQGLDPVFLAAPTSTDERLKRIADASSGFLYLVSRSGVTGVRNELAETLAPLVRRARDVTSLPLAVGFGISNPQQVRAVQHLADAAVVGSAIVHAIEERYSTGGGPAIRDFVRWLKHGTGGEPA